MRIRSALTMLVSISVSSIAVAEAPMVAIDANGAVVGAVLDLPTSDNGWTARVLYRYAGDEIVVLRITAGGLSQAANLYYTGANCTGEARVTQFSEIQPSTPYPTAFLDSAGNLRRVAANATTSSPFTDCRFFGPATCDCSSDWFFVTLPVTDLGPFPFVFPFEYVLNPDLFTDQFQTGDTRRWSQVLP